MTHKHFTTQPQDVVDAFADEWGFIKTHSVVVTTVEEVQDFANKCAENGEWNGEAIEGFVVRTNVSLAVGDVTPAPVEGEEEVEAPPTKGKGKGKKSTATILPPPYPAGSTFFFKIKFDEPYMMYRDWREITKMLHSKYMKNPGVPLSLSSISEKRMRRKETNVYAHWVKQEIERDATQFNNFNKGKGIIATRERFLEWLKNEEGVGAISQLEAVEKQQEEGELKFTKTIIFPVAIPGCGTRARLTGLSPHKLSPLTFPFLQVKRPSQERLSTFSISATPSLMMSKAKSVGLLSSGMLPASCRTTTWS